MILRMHQILDCCPHFQPHSFNRSIPPSFLSSLLGYFYPFSQEVNLKEGSLIRNKNSREINLLEGGYKRPFQSGHGFLARGFDFGDVIAVEGTLLDKIPGGEPIP